MKRAAAAAATLTVVTMAGCGMSNPFRDQQPAVDERQPTASSTYLEAPAGEEPRGALKKIIATKVNPKVTPSTVQKTICTVGYTKTVRPSSSVTRKIKQQLVAEQHPGTEVSDWILDHLIPLQGGGEAGGIGNVDNFLLQPKQASYDKDAAEDAMNEDICDGRVPLRKAQEAMATDWTRYQELVAQ